MHRRRTVHGKPVRYGLGGVVAAALALAVLKELRTPAGQRQWHGSLAGVPYDLRPPTWERLKASLWAPAVPHVLVPRSFGIGWSVNVARVADVVRKLLGGRASGAA
jgi:hypothetical protein